MPLTVKEDPAAAEAESMRNVLAVAAVWTTIFVVVPLAWRHRLRREEKGLHIENRFPAAPGSVPVQILFAEAFEDHVRVDCVQLAETQAHEAGYPLTLRIARPAHPALDGAMKRTLADLAERLAQVDLRFSVREGEPTVRIARDRTSMTFDLGAAA